MLLSWEEKKGEVGRDQNGVSELGKVGGGRQAGEEAKERTREAREKAPFRTTRAARVIQNGVSEL